MAMLLCIGVNRHRAELREGKLYWDDGDVWERMPAPDLPFCHCKRCKKQWPVPPGPPSIDGTCDVCHPAEGNALVDAEHEMYAFSICLVRGIRISCEIQD